MRRFLAGTVLLACACATPQLERPAMRALDASLTDLRDELDAPEVGEVLARVRTLLETSFPPGARDEGTRRAAGVLFEVHPQGTRSLFGIRPTDRRYLRDGVLTVRPFVAGAVDADHSYARLGGNLAALADVAVRADPTSHPYVDGAVPSAADVRLWREPADLYARVTGLCARPGPARAVYVASLRVPYAAGDESRVASWGFYFAQCEPGGPVTLVGSDFHDVDRSGAHDPVRYAGSPGLAWPFHQLWRGLSYANDVLFQDTWIGWLPNAAANVAVNVLVAAKETAFEVVKVPFAGLASLAADGPLAERVTKSTFRPLASVPDVWEHHLRVVGRDGGRTSWLSHLWTGLGALPIFGPYLGGYRNDPWASYAEAPARPHDVSGARFYAWSGAAPPPHVVLTRGVHGRDREHQGTAVWEAAVEQAARDAGAPLAGDVVVAAYPWGTVADPVFSLLNLSSGSAYTMANDVADAVRGGDAPPVVTMLAHGGGVQRAAVASGLLWRRGVFTRRILGAAGPSAAPTPTKPGAFRVLFDPGEEEGDALAAGFGLGLATVERWFVAPLEIPLVGPVWLFSAPAVGEYESVVDADVAVTAGGASAVAPDPGAIDAARRDPGLAPFRGELGHLLRADRLPVRAYLEARDGDRVPDRRLAPWRRPWPWLGGRPTAGSPSRSSASPAGTRR